MNFNVIVRNPQGEPIPGATLQRHYPNGPDEKGDVYAGGNYSNAIAADAQGRGNLPVPSTFYGVYITSAGYNAVDVPFKGLADAGTATVTMQPNYEGLDPVTVTPASKIKSALPLLLLAGAGLYYAHKQRWI